MKKVFCFNNCACRVFRTNLVLFWFQCCPSYLSRKKGISGTFLSLGLRPLLQKNFPRFPFFYFGNLDNTSIRQGQICPQTWQHNYWNKILFQCIFLNSRLYLFLSCNLNLNLEIKVNLRIDCKQVTTLISVKSWSLVLNSPTNAKRFQKIWIALSVWLVQG